MNIKKEGHIAKFFTDKGFGFIHFNDEKSIFFHSSNTLENLVVGDKVIFELGESKKKPGQPEAYYVRKTYPQPNGYLLALGKNFQAVPEALVLLLEYLKEFRLERHSEEQISITKSFSHVVGAALAVATSEDDDVFYAKRYGKKGYYRFVRGKEPMPSKELTIIVNFIKAEEIYEVSACYFGPKTPPAPWDQRATADAFYFWRKHALIPHESFKINYSDVKTFDPDFFKTFDEMQGRI